MQVPGIGERRTPRQQRRPGWARRATATLALTLGIAGALAPCPTALADEVTLSEAQRKAAAREAANRAADAYDAGDFEAAIELFSKAEELQHAPPHLLYLARANAALGRLLEAQELYRRLVREELPSSAPRAFHDARAEATRELAALEPRVPKVQLRLDVATDDVEVTLDDVIIPSVMLDLPVPLNPGHHVVVARADGRAEARAEFDAPESETVEVPLTLGPVTSAEAPPPAPAEPPAAAPERRRRPLRIAGYSLAAVGLGGVGAGVALLVVGQGKTNEADQLFEDSGCGDAGCSDAIQAEIQALDDDSASLRTFGVVGLAAGGAVLATGVTLVVLDRKGKRAEPAVALTPVLGPGFAGLRGRF